ncbi:glyoxalase/bleomycin resistance protein/dioxygenase superfamily protein [Roseibium hamelinense]|uniref:Glyoxalase/bleomycin resistance protein/dioxygenase superfamily protein n=1 Tax=Roseibium hamelinense TaxID=150831 RepID=A0A562TGD9_9HYPH|nr:VOC family protein [Roseibium hamelinense]MTI46159.1 hypothetical protein [Roseibium hamelinense]TWI92649.1 glyoxalase/bleomycin resistance protein/dioxygenase superfamily protein [Roseibium hamelinense]
MSPMLTAGIDHVGLTVPDLDQAVATVQGLLDGGLCYIEGPIQEPEPGWMAKKLGATRATSLRVAAMNVGGANLELFEYRVKNGSRECRAAGRENGFALLIESPDMAKLSARLAEVPHKSWKWGGGDVLVKTASGLRLLIRKAAEDRLTPMVFLGTGEFEVLVPDFLTLFEMKEVRRITALGAVGVVLRGHAGANLAVLKANQDPVRPANSEPGGHHVAFHADDVDAAASRLSKAGYRPFGEPETIADGPIAGDRWVYLGSPTGLQLELIHMPDGNLPYEAAAGACRSPIRKGM